MPVLPPVAVRWLHPTLIIQGQDTIVSVDIERTGQSVTFTSAPTLTLYDEDGTALTDPALTATVAGTTATFTVANALTTSSDLSGRYLVKLSFQVAGEQARASYNDAAFGIADLVCPVGVTDLTQRSALVKKIAASGATTLQDHITQAWGELLSQLHADDAPYWTIRSSAKLRPWLIARSQEIALRDAGLPLASGNPYTAEANRLEGLLAGPEGLYHQLRVRLDPDEDNKAASRSDPVVDTRRDIA